MDIKGTSIFQFIFLSRIVANVALAILLSLFLENGHAQETQSMVNPNEVRHAIVRAVAKSTKSRALLIDPRITDQIYANTMLYVGNFCPNPKENCAARFGGDSDLDSLVDQHLGDISDLPSKPIKSLAERLAPGEFHKTGWEPNISVNAGRVEIPLSLQGNPIALGYATELVPIGMGGTAILMAPGSAELIFTVAGKPQSYQVIVERLHTITLQNVVSSQDVRPGGVLQPVPSAYCWITEQPPYTGPFALFNSGRMTIAESAESKRSNEAPFTRQTVLPIQVTIEKGVECSEGCKISLASLFAEAIATWRSGCLRCDPNAMTMIATMGTTWLDSRIVQRLNNLSTKPTTSLDLHRVEEREKEITPVSPLGGGGPGIQTYLDISSDVPTKQRICQLDNDAAPWVVSVKGYLCQRKRSDQKESLRPVVVLKKGKTSCGELAIACGLPLERVEISLSKYRYELPGHRGEREIVIGIRDSGEVLEMRRIILHEVGHWVGIPHAQIGGKDEYLDVMSDTYGQGESCVSAHSLRMMANAADLRWKYRVKDGGGALLEPRGH